MAQFYGLAGEDIRTGNVVTIDECGKVMRTLISPIPDHTRIINFKVTAELEDGSVLSKFYLLMTAADAFRKLKENIADGLFPHIPVDVCDFVSAVRASPVRILNGVYIETY